MCENLSNNSLIIYLIVVMIRRGLRSLYFGSILYDNSSCQVHKESRVDRKPRRQ